MALLKIGYFFKHLTYLLIGIISSSIILRQPQSDRELIIKESARLLAKEIYKDVFLQHRVALSAAILGALILFIRVAIVFAKRDKILIENEILKEKLRSEKLDNDLKEKGLNP